MKFFLGADSVGRLYGAKLAGEDVMLLDIQVEHGLAMQTDRCLDSICKRRQFRPPEEL